MKLIIFVFKNPLVGSHIKDKYQTILRALPLPVSIREEYPRAKPDVSIRLEREN